MRPALSAHESLLREQALESDSHPFRSYTCPDCGRSVRCLEFDGRCLRCSGTEDEAEALLAQIGQRRRAIRYGHLKAAKLLHSMGHHDRARIHEEEAERV